MINFIRKIVKKLYKILKKKNMTPKRIWKIICGASVMTIFTILGLMNDYFGLASFFVSKPDVDINEAVSIDYLEAKGFDIWYKGKKKKVKSDSRTMTFFVNSIYGEQIINNVEEHTESELTEWIMDDSETVAASYPYVDLDVNRKRNP